jgi:phenylpropionate dioxygenase-like ring-hydroxylating dioxygenase large terminal subunit
MSPIIHRLAEQDAPEGVRDLRKTGSHPDHWYPLARSADLEPGKVIGTWFAGEPVALVRTETGAVFALEDRCAHRQVPLHQGVVAGEHLRCCYHGWTYDSKGACIAVPYLAKGAPRPTGVRSYPCREAYGMVFVFTGDAARLPAASFPDIPSWSDPAYRTRVLDRTVACHYSFMHENLMDMNHQFLHRRLMGRIRTDFLELRRGDGAVEVDYTFKRAAGRQPLGELFMIGRRRAPTAGRAFDLMTIATRYPYQTLKFWTAGADRPALDLWNVYVPLDRAQRTNRTLGLMMIRKPATPGLVHLLWPFIVWFTEGIFAEDRAIVEAEQAAFDRQGADWNQEVFPVIQALRKLLVDRGVPLD